MSGTKKRISVRFDMSRELDRDIYEWLRRETKRSSISGNAFILLTLGNAMNSEPGRGIIPGPAPNTIVPADGMAQDPEPVPKVPVEALDFIDSIW